MSRGPQAAIWAQRQAEERQRQAEQEMDSDDWVRPEYHPVERGFVCGSCGLSDYTFDETRDDQFWTPQPCGHCAQHFYERENAA